MSDSMDDEYDLTDFDGVCRLFPLPKTVLFPHVVLPLHIFEPRYRQMTEDALASGDNLVTIVQLCEPEADQGLGAPPVEMVACVGRILQHQRLADGRYNLLLLGLKRVRLRGEIRSDKPYRLATAAILPDDSSIEGPDPRRDKLVEQLRRLLKSDKKHERDLSVLLDTSLPTGVLTDLLAHALNLDAGVKQTLLAEHRVDRRVDRLLQLIDDALGRADPADREVRPFPPPFSEN